MSRWRAALPLLLLVAAGLAAHQGGGLQVLAGAARGEQLGRGLVGLLDEVEVLQHDLAGAAAAVRRALRRRIVVAALLVRRRTALRSRRPSPRGALLAFPFSTLLAGSSAPTVVVTVLPAWPAAPPSAASASPAAPAPAVTNTRRSARRRRNQRPSQE